MTETHPWGELHWTCECGQLNSMTRKNCLNYAFVAPMADYSKEINIKSGGHIVIMDRTNDNEIAILCEYLKGMFDIK